MIPFDKINNRNFIAGSRIEKAWTGHRGVDTSKIKLGAGYGAHGLDEETASVAYNGQRVGHVFDVGGGRWHAILHGSGDEGTFHPSMESGINAVVRRHKDFTGVEKAAGSAQIPHPNHVGPAVQKNNRQSLIKWHQWNDHNGTYSDEDSKAEGMKPMSLSDAQDLYLEKMSELSHKSVTKSLQVVDGKMVFKSVEDPSDAGQMHPVDIADRTMGPQLAGDYSHEDVKGAIVHALNIARNNPRLRAMLHREIEQGTMESIADAAHQLHQVKPGCCAPEHMERAVLHLAEQRHDPELMHHVHGYIDGA